MRTEAEILADIARVPPRVDDVLGDPRTALQAANEIAFAASPETLLRELASIITDRCKDMYLDGPVEIARWILRRIRYRREANGWEVLQGPFTTLRTGLGDCDDLAILWCALCRSVGLPAFVIAVGDDHEWGYHHALGYSPDVGLVEMTDDTEYRGMRGPGDGTIPAFPAGASFVTAYYDPEAESFVEGNVAAAPEPSSFPFAVVVPFAIAALLFWHNRKKAA